MNVIPVGSNARGASDYCGELQSLRGLAALLVVFYHSFCVFELSGTLLQYNWVLLNGQGAVILFFLLSGFVLAIQWEKIASEPRAFLSFAIRRVTRLYPMLIFTAVVGTLYCNLLHNREPLQNASEWYYKAYISHINWFHFFSSAVGYSGKPAAPLWSLWIELVGSAMVPLALYAARRRQQKVALAGLLLVMSFWLNRNYHFHLPVYLIDFYAGASILWWGRAFATWFSRLVLWRQFALMAALVGVFLLAPVFFSPEEARSLHNLLEMASAIPFIAIIYYGAWRPSVLRRRGANWLGDISYSVYLLHFPILYLLIHGMTKISGLLDVVPVEILTLVLTGLTTAISIAASAITYRYIELPSIQIGKRFVSTLQSSSRRGFSPVA